MAPLAKNPVPAFQHPPLHHQPTAAAGPKNNTENDLRARRGPVRGLRERKTIRIILNAYDAVQRRGQIDIEGMAVQRVRIGILHQPRRRADRTRYPNPDRDANAKPPLCLRHQRKNCSDHPVIIRRRRHTISPRRLAIRP